MKRQFFLIIGTIIKKRNSSVVVRTIFCRGFRVRASDTLYNLINYDVTFRPCVHANVVSVYPSMCIPVILYFLQPLRVWSFYGFLGGRRTANFPLDESKPIVSRGDRL